MSSVVNLVPPTVEPSQEIIDELENLLTEAKSGKIIALCVVTESANNTFDTLSIFPKGASQAVAVCGLEWLKLRILRAL